LAFNLEKFTPDRNFYTGSARGARDKYEVCNRVDVVFKNVASLWLPRILNRSNTAQQIKDKQFDNWHHYF